MIGSDEIKDRGLCVLCKKEPGYWIKPWKLELCKACFLKATTKTLETAMAGEVKEDDN